jgi:hypothetical protein
MDVVDVADVDLDAAVEQLAQRFRAALDEPLRATAAHGARTLRARFDEPLPERERRPPPS